MAPSMCISPALLQTALKGEYDDYGFLFYVFVFPKDLGDGLSFPGRRCYKLETRSKILS